MRWRMPLKSGPCQNSCMHFNSQNVPASAPRHLDMIMCALVFLRFIGIGHVLCLARWLVIAVEMILVYYFGFDDHPAKSRSADRSIQAD